MYKIMFHNLYHIYIADILDVDVTEYGNKRNRL